MLQLDRPQSRMPPGCSGSSEIKQFPYRQVQPFSHSLKHIKAGRINPPFNQAEEVDANANELRELLLRQLTVQPDCL